MNSQYMEYNQLLLIFLQQLLVHVFLEHIIK